jgi:hypothetical protein
VLGTRPDDEVIEEIKERGLKTISKAEFRGIIGQIPESWWYHERTKAGRS